MQYLTRILALSLLLSLIACSGTKPLDLGVNDGKLKECPKSPNCVSTLTTSDKHKMEPLSYTGNLADAKAKLLKVIAEMPRTTVTINEANYLHVEFMTKMMKYVDDVEFLFDDEKKVIHYRSASRKGYSDMGLNKKRMTEVKAGFAK